MHIPFEGLRNTPAVQWPSSLIEIGWAVGDLPFVEVGLGEPKRDVTQLKLGLRRGSTPSDRAGR